MKKIKILIYGMTDVNGGLEMYLYNLSKYCNYEKYSLDFLNVYDHELMYQRELQEKGCNIINLTPSNKNFKACKKELKKLLHEEIYDYIYLNASHYSRFHFIVNSVKPKHTKIILHSHAIDNLKQISFASRIIHRLGKFYFGMRSVLRVACGTEAGKFLFGRKKFIIFNNGIDIEKFRFNENCRNEIRKEFTIKDSELLFGHIARLSPEKNHDFLIDIFSKIVKEKNNSKLVVVGDGTERKKLESKVKELGLVEKVIFTGDRKDAYKFYSALDAFIMPSLSEGFGISIAEAQANGLFCFGSDILDKTTNLTGNIKYISLNLSPDEWADIILKNMKRDCNVIEKFSKEFEAAESYRKIFNCFEEFLCKK